EHTYVPEDVLHKALAEYDAPPGTPAWAQGMADAQDRLDELSPVQLARGEHSTVVRQPGENDEQLRARIKAAAQEIHDWPQPKLEFPRVADAGDS
ncbi:hypothetical protein LCGC14_1959000, partial [marine sediment metagenome]